MTDITPTIGDRSKVDCTLVHMGQAWRVLGVGAERNRNTYCHLASLHNFRIQKNGKVPMQIGDWIDNAVLAAANDQS